MFGKEIFGIPKEELDEAAEHVEQQLAEAKFPDRVTDLIVDLMQKQHDDLYKVKAKVAMLRERLLGIPEADTPPEEPINENHGTLDVIVYSIHDNNKLLKEIEEILDHLAKV